MYTYVTYNRAYLRNSRLPLGRKRAENSDIARLQSVRCMRRETYDDDTVFLEFKSVRTKMR
jgi:hypothetical protein